MCNNKIPALLFITLIILCLLSVFLNRETAEVFEPVEETESLEPEEETLSKEDENEEEEFNEREKEEAPDIYDLTGYIYKNSAAYMERLKTEVNNLANDACDKDNLYGVAESIRLNQISYYTMLNSRYGEGADDLVEACKSYAFNAEAMAANIMSFITDGRTKYISRAMLCISADNTLSYNFSAAQSAYAAAREAAEAEVMTEYTEEESADS